MKKKTKRIKDIDPSAGFRSLSGLKFYLPGTNEAVYWYSQWNYSNGKAGVWYKKDLMSGQIFPLQLDSLEEALDFIVVE
jgi:hypothetical protein